MRVEVRRVAMIVARLFEIDSVRPDVAGELVEQYALTGFCATGLPHETLAASCRDKIRLAPHRSDGCWD